MKPVIQDCLRVATSIFVGLLAVVVLFSCNGWAQVWFVSPPTFSTNRPDQHFTAASGGTAVFHNSNLCRTVRFTITGAAGVYDLQWARTPAGPWLNLYPPLAINGNLTTNLPMIPEPGGFWRIKKRDV